MNADNRKQLVQVILLTLLLTFSINAYAAEDWQPPENIILSDTFKPGIGKPVGKILLVQGKAIVTHSRGLDGFIAEKEMLLYQGDTIYSQEEGRLRLKLNDGSLLSLSSRTKLVINKSVYNPEKQDRTSLLKMGAGKTRFIIRKFSAFKNRDVKIKTETAIVGVRGSDFIIVADKSTTRVTALENTELEIISLALPCDEADILAGKAECVIEPLILTDYQQTVVQENQLPSAVEEMLPEDIARMKQDFSIDSDTTETTETTVDSGTTSSGKDDDINLKPIEDMEFRDIYVEPDVPAQPVFGTVVIPAGAFDEMNSQTRDILDQQTEVSGLQQEDKVVNDLIKLAPFPGTPQ